MSWIKTPIATKWPERTPDGVDVSERCRITGKTETGAGYPWSRRDREALLALPGAVEDPENYALVADASRVTRDDHHARTPGKPPETQDTLAEGVPDKGVSG